jgi:hypothetical protein
MLKKCVLPTLALLCLVALMLNAWPVASQAGQYQRLSSAESEIVAKINGTNIYSYDLELEQIALNHNLSLYSFRSSGSVGANETAQWIEEQFESFGLDTHNETFQFTTWNLLTQPVLIIDADGNLSTTDDQEEISSFQCEHFSCPTPEGGVFSKVVSLPLPYQATSWKDVNITDRVLLIGGKVESDRDSFLAFKSKLQNEKPSVVIFCWSSSTMSSSPIVFSSCGGRPNSGVGPFFWDYNMTVGWVNYEDGQLIQNRTRDAAGISAFVSVQSVIDQGPHYNIVAKLEGTGDPQKMILISAHYDSSMSAGFCDNGAGTAAILELSRVFSEAARQGVYKPEYTLVFVAFAGEELGLEGSIAYVKQHASELADVVAVFDLDSIGSETMMISKTFPDDRGLDLKNVVMNAGSDLNVEIGLADPGVRRSDFQAFLDPADTNDLQLQLWIADAGIRNMTRVKSSILIYSSPLTYIHTANDNSASANWISADKLENQTRVAGLSVIRVLSTLLNPFLLQLYVSITAAGVVAAVVAYFKRSRIRTLYRALVSEVRSFIGMREVLYIVILTVILLFMSFALYASQGETEVLNQGYPRITTVEYYGTPFKMIAVISTMFARSEGSPQLVDLPGSLGGFNLLWEGLLANIILFSLSAFVIAYVVAKLKYIYDYRRQDRV